LKGNPNHRKMYALSTMKHLLQGKALLQNNAFIQVGMATEHMKRFC